MIRAVVVVLVISATTFAQTPSIEVATVKLNHSADAIGNRFDPDRMTWTGVPLGVLIQEAYGVQPYQVSGGPIWLGSDRWDINAKTDGPTSFTQKLQLLQSLLADRFQLRFHSETREMKAYKLVVAKGGPKLQEVKEGDPLSGSAGTRIGKGLIQGHKVAISDLAHFLQSELGRPVQEATGLTGKYDFKLEWVPDESQPNSGGEAPPPDAEGPSIFRAIQEQLGLKLEAQKAPGEILVIDHAAKPIGN
jgi:uncharacterized protein (TIGR03435 family)